MRFTKKKISAVVATTAVVALGAGAAFAFWSSTGSGTGSGTTGTSTPFTVTSTAAEGDVLLPGVGAQTIDFTVTNPTEAGHQKLNLVTVAVKNADGTAWVPTGSNAGCSAADYTVSVTTPPEYTDMDPGDTRTGTATLEMNNLATNQDACKGITVPLYFAAS
jgi:hypothetical protein